MSDDNNAGNEEVTPDVPPCGKLKRKRTSTPPRREQGPEETVEISLLELESAFHLSKRVDDTRTRKKQAPPPLPFAYRVQDEEEREEERNETDE